MIILLSIKIKSPFELLWEITEVEIKVALKKKLYKTPNKQINKIHAKAR